MSFSCPVTQLSSYADWTFSHSGMKSDATATIFLLGVSLLLWLDSSLVIRTACLHSVSTGGEVKISFDFSGTTHLEHWERFIFKTDWTVLILGSLNIHKINVCMNAKFPIEHDLGLRDHVSHFLPYYLCSALKVNEY